MNNQRPLNFSHLGTVQYFRSSGQKLRVETKIHISYYITTSNTQPKKSNTIQGEKSVVKGKARSCGFVPLAMSTRQEAL